MYITQYRLRCHLNEIAFHPSILSLRFLGKSISKYFLTTIRQRVEVTTEQQLNVIPLASEPQRARRVIQYGPQLVTKHHSLDKLHVAKLGVPVYVGSAHQYWLTQHRSVGR
jgi:hypothetical protein